MARDLNKVMLIGHLGADPAMRFINDGTAVTTFRVASNREWTTDDQKHESTEWFRVVAWEALGEICNQYLTKGTRVYVEGRLQTRKWQDREGQERYTTEVVAHEMIILSAREPATVPAAEPEEVAPPATPKLRQRQQRTEPAETPPPTRRSRQKPLSAVPEEDLPF
ncbi:MAG: single-stranded DNA-binding protein [Blastochloris sp.]|nr:single-stranded DNA-binding protein [Blastochloris sp.]